MNTKKHSSQYKKLTHAINDVSLSNLKKSVMFAKSTLPWKQKKEILISSTNLKEHEKVGCLLYELVSDTFVKKWFVRIWEIQTVYQILVTNFYVIDDEYQQKYNSINYFLNLINTGLNRGQHVKEELQKRVDDDKKFTNSYNKFLDIYKKYEEITIHYKFELINDSLKDYLDADIVHIIVWYF
jgi:hypothetical protein